MAYTKIIAHRGSRGNRPENTLEAFQEALKVSSDGIELDVHLSKDGQVVVIHDETVDRTTSGKGYVKDMTLKQLKELDAGSWFDPKYSNARIPTLQEVLDLLAENHFSGVLNVELKTDVFQYSAIEEKVLALAEPYLAQFSVIYSSFHYETLKRIKEKQPDAEIIMLSGQGSIKTSIEAMIVATAQKYAGHPGLARAGLNPVEFRIWFQSLVKQESGFSIGARSPVGAFGLTQVMPDTAKDLGIYLMAAVPKATIIGFTGTPIARTSQGEGTFKIFGT